jgi:hypothetical protein
MVADGSRISSSPDILSNAGALPRCSLYLTESLLVGPVKTSCVHSLLRRAFVARRISRKSCVPTIRCKTRVLRRLASSLQEAVEALSDQDWRPPGLGPHTFASRIEQRVRVRLEPEASKNCLTLWPPKREDGRGLVSDRPHCVRVSESNWRISSWHWENWSTKKGGRSAA